MEEDRNPLIVNVSAQESDYVASTRCTTMCKRGDMRHLRTLTVALLLGTLWPVGPVSDATALRVMASSDVACGTGLGESSRSQRFVIRCDTCNSDWGVCHTDTVPRRTGVGKEEEHGLKVSRVYGAEERVWIREAGSDRAVGEKWIMRILIIQRVGRSNVSVMQICYWLGGSGLESRQGSKFPLLEIVQTSFEAHPTS